MCKTKNILFVLILISNNLFAQEITTIAGTGQNGHSGDGGPALKAQLNYPTALARDKKGNLYFIESGFLSNNSGTIPPVIRKISSLGIISTYAGNGQWAYGFNSNIGDGSLAINAPLNDAYSLAIDTACNLYIGTSFAIRKVDTFGIISTFAGTGIGGYDGDGGLAINAKIAFPFGMAIDNMNNLYFSDEDNFVVRRVNSEGIISTYAGNGTKNSSIIGGSGIKAINVSLGDPRALTTDRFGNLFIYNINTIRKVDTSGIITLFAGKNTNSNAITNIIGDDGLAINAPLPLINGMTTDYNGNLYLTDLNVIRKINTNGIINTYVGNNIQGYLGDGGPAINAELNNPCAIATDSSGNLYIVDEDNFVIRKVGLCSFLPSIIRKNVTICSGYSYQLPSGKLVTSQGNYLDTLHSRYGCDSIIYSFLLQVDSLSHIKKNIPICEGNSVILSSSVHGSYLWNTGDITNSISVNIASIYTVLITDSLGCTGIDSFTVIEYNNPKSILVKDTSFCVSGTLDAGNGYQSYLWNTGSSQEFININHTGVYWVNVTDVHGCQTIDTVNITSIFTNPSNFLIKDTIMCGGTPITIAASQNYQDYLWSTGAITNETKINKAGSYFLKVTDFNGCWAYDTVTVTEKICFSNVDIPNAFSPNGDGINDTWKIKYLNIYPNATVNVFNRYGQSIFHSIGYIKEWDGRYNGKDLPIGTYYYVIKLNPQSVAISGSVTILK